MISRAGHTLLKIIIIIFTGIDLKAQSFNPDYNFKHLNVQNGLTQNIVYHFLQDSLGYMWVGTHNGLNLFDGIRTINFLHNEQDPTSISGNFINSILEDSAQQIWIGNETGIDLYNRANNSFSHFGVDRPDGTKENTYCVALGFNSANELWFLDTKTRSVRSLNTKTKGTSFISELNASHALFYKSTATQSIHIWSAYDKGTIHQVYKNNQLMGQHTFFSGKGNTHSYPVLQVSHVFQQNDTTVWLSTNEGLVKLNPANNKYSIFKKWQNRVVRELRYAAMSPKGQLWLGSGPDGIYTFDINTNQFIDNFRNDKLDPFSICSDNIVSLYFDKTGHLWCGSYGNGSSYASIEDPLFTNHLSKNELRAWNGNNSISWLDVDGHENIWCMLQNMQGFWILNKEFEIKMYRNPLLVNGKNFNNGITKLLFDGDNIWCATNIGLYTYHLQTNTMHFVKYDLISEEVQGSIWIKDLIRLYDGSLLFSTYAGLYRLTNEAGRYVIKPINFLKPGVFNGFGPLFQDKENFIYVRTLSDFLYILKPNHEGREYVLIKTIRFTPLVNYYFNENGDSIIYLATTDGLYHINNKNFQIKKEEISGKLSFRNISSVFRKDNMFWIFGDKGLYFFDVDNNNGQLYTTEDGLPANDFNRSAFIFTPNGRCIAGTSDGLVSFVPNREQKSVYPPRPQLTNIYINDISHTSTANPNELKKINLSYRQNTFSFDFAPITFQHAAGCSFEYKLEGYDDDWIKSGPAHYTRYSKIPPGDYVFNLRVTDAAGRVSPFIKALEIQIAKAFWQTNVFKIAVSLFILLLGWLLSRWYFSYRISKQKMEFEKLQAIEKERTRIATDMHDDLGSGLSRIKFLSQSIRNKKIEDETVKTELEKITSFSDEMTEKMGEIVWALNEKNDTLADLVAYSRSYAIEYLANHNIVCKANTPLGLPGTFITGEIRRNIFLSVKECLHNIVKHADASCVNFTVELGSMIKITIHDNGRGIDWDNKRAFSNGIQNIQKRMKDLKGEVKFRNEQGTKVVLTIPLNN